MVIEIFNENIAVPAKCGTRYFSKCVKSPERPTDYMEHTTSCLPQQSEVKLPNGEPFPFEDIDLWKKVEYLVVRDPYEHLKTALHTELITLYKDYNKFEFVIKEFVSWGGNAHWHPYFYRRLYYAHKNYGIPRFKIIHMEEITDFVKSLGYDIEYNKEEYNFNDKPNWKSKDEICELVKNTFPNEWKQMMDFISNDMEYYHYIINNKKKLI